MEKWDVINSLTNFTCGHTGAQLTTPRNAKNEIDCSKLNSKMVHYVSAFTVMLKTTRRLIAFFSVHLKRARNFFSQSGSVSANTVKSPSQGFYQNNSNRASKPINCNLNLQGIDDQAMECRRRIIGEYPIYQTPTNLLRNYYNWTNNGRG